MKKVKKNIKNLKLLYRQAIGNADFFFQKKFKQAELLKRT